MRCCMIFDADHADRDSMFARGQRLIFECETVFVSSRTTLNHVTHDNAVWEGPERGAVYAIPPSLVAMLAAKDKRRWEDYTRDANVVSQCSRRADPEG
ncbi:hypothetical protein V6N11_043042 [Hibiscus sabdariffa]|uniref:Uncharacterized protein n=1 Tax=Hibiscus sabdariffa TaxID=183260 RepID=A0ABR2QYR5_9ROSI